MLLMWSLLAVPGLIALNAFLVCAEYAVVAIRPPQIAAMERGRWPRAARAMARLKENPGSAIGAIQVCITMTNLMLGWIGEPAMSAALLRLLGPLATIVSPSVFQGASLVLSFIVVTLLTVVFSELLPKALTMRYVVPAAALTAMPVLVLGRITRPLVWLMNTMANAVTRPLGLGGVDEVDEHRVTMDELVLLANQAASDGVVTPRERSIILSALTLGRRKAREVMVPRTRVTFLDLRRSMEENRRIIEQHLHTRLPLCDGALDKTKGVVHTKEFLLADQEKADISILTLIARKPVFVPENVSLDRLLAAFKEHQTEMVFLADEYGGIEGIVTLQDVVDELVGELSEPAWIPKPGNGAGEQQPICTPLMTVAGTAGQAGHGTRVLQTSRSADPI